MLDDIDLDIPEDDDDLEIVSAPRRSFVTIAGILGAILVVALIAIGIYAIIVLPQRQAAELEEHFDETATVVAQAALASDSPTSAPSATSKPSATNTEIPNTATVTASVASPTQEATDQDLADAGGGGDSEEAAATASSTATAISASSTSTSTSSNGNAASQTAVNLLTEAAEAQTQAASTLGSPSLTPTVTPPPALPDSGFADKANAPNLLISAVLLMLIIILSRRLQRSFQ